ncbi:MAG: putative membrane protein [Lysobacterales bacterium]
MSRNLIAWLSVFFAALIWSAINPHDMVTWWLEVLPAMIGLGLMIVTRSSFPLTPLLYVLVLVHSVILMVGGHYTYAEVPLGDWLQAISGGERNNYDKLGHFAQGFIPAILAREILVRKEVINVQAWLGIIVVSICLAFSAFYELLEWAAALLSEQGAEAFLGTQGYVWDTQSDMLWALSGAILSLLLLSGLHDRQIAALPCHSQ